MKMNITFGSLLRLQKCFDILRSCKERSMHGMTCEVTKPPRPLTNYILWKSHKLYAALHRVLQDCGSLSMACLSSKDRMKGLLISINGSVSHMLLLLLLYENCRKISCCLVH